MKSQSVFWIGAHYDDGDWIFLGGAPLPAAASEIWAQSYPTETAYKFCVTLHYVLDYKAANYYCGDKLAFICHLEPVASDLV